MSAFQRRGAGALAGLLVAAGVWACTATRGGDGSLLISFAPDMTVTAWGLEDALSKLIDLRGHCQDGTFPRPCTQPEMDDISKTIGKVIEAKKRMHNPDAPTPGGSLVI